MFWLCLPLFPFALNSGGLSENMYFKCLDYTTENMIWGVPSRKFFYFFANLSDMSDCVQGEELLGKLDPEEKV